MLDSLLQEFSELSCLLRMPNFGKSNVLKVNIGWAALIAAGLGSFVLARNQVLEKRQKQLQKQKDIIDKVEREAVAK